jgi:hypothetical protein
MPNLIRDPSTYALIAPANFNIEPCDIFLTRGNSILDKLIRIREVEDVHSNDKFPRVNHTGIVIEKGTIETANVIEALTTVQEHTLWSEYHGKSDEITIFRPLNLTPEQKTTIVDKAVDYKGRKYGYLKIAGNALDFFLGGAYVFRRLTNNDNYPICSWVVAESYSKVDKTFGVAPGAATPENICDFCVLHPNEYRLLFNLQTI